MVHNQLFMNVALFFGSFNPIHIGHLIIGNHILSYYDIDQLWFVLSPKNPLKNQNELLNEYHRQHLLQSAIYGESKLKCSIIEFGLPRPSYTIDTLTYLKEKYPQHHYTIVMGSDSFRNVKNWKSGELILNEYSIMVYKRPGFEVKNSQSNIKIVDAPLLDISSSRIRNMIKNKKSIKFLVPDAVKEEIEANSYYKESNLKNPS